MPTPTRTQSLPDCGRALPFRQFVLKIHSRCDLACDHCYVYKHADQSWRGRPTVISPETAAQAGERIAEHASKHRLGMVRVILHGGEPLLGGVSGTESLGLAPSDVAVIETDGTIEQADSIKVAYDGAIKARQQGASGLSPVCRQCPVVDSCGGGLYAHRYRTGSGFDNPSVYCTDLEKIITHVRARLGLPMLGRLRVSDVAAAWQAQAHWRRSAVASQTACMRLHR